MDSSGGERDTGVYRGAGALVDEGVVPKYFHGLDGAGEAGGDVRSHLHRGGDGAVVVGGGDGDSSRAGEGGGQVVGGMPVLEQGNTSGGKDQEDAQDNILDKAALGARNLGRVHRASTRKYAADFL